MSFALVDGLSASWWAAVPVGLCWGFIILNLDRLLIQNIRAGGTVWRTIAMVLPRLIVAGLLGLVIATPLVLRVFQGEIVANMREENARATVELGKTRSDTPEAKELADLENRIRVNEGILAGDVPGLKSQNVDAARTTLADAERNLEAKRKIANDAYDRMVCELAGERCNGASGNKGPGPRYQALKKQYEVAAADVSSAQRAVAAAQTALDKANQDASNANTNAVAEAQEAARTELPGLRARRDALKAKLAGLRSGDLATQISNTGLLAQIEALGRVGDASSSARNAHWAVAGLLFMIELLPVLVKFFMSVGPPSVYDRISELDDSSTLDDATQRRNMERRQIEARSKKQRAVEDDMLNREQALGLRANAHVAREMEKILDVALAQWTAQVTSNLNTNGSNGTGPGGPPGANGSQPGTSGIPPQPNHGPIRSRFGLPPGPSL